MKSVDLYFQLAIHAGEQVKAYLPRSKDEFFNDPMRQDGVCMRLQEMGENISKVRKEFPRVFSHHANDRWFTLIGLRNAISHTFAEINMHAVWNIATKEIDPVMRQLKRITTRPQGSVSPRAES